MPEVTSEQVKQLIKDFPPEALSDDSSRGFKLTSIKQMYIIERLNDVFGILGWTYDYGEFTYNEEAKEYSVSVKLHLVNPETGEIMRTIPQEGGHHLVISKKDGILRHTDSRKSAVTDGLTKCASVLGIGISIFKGQYNGKQPSRKDEKPWKELRETKKLGGEGQYKNELWKDINAGLLFWCVDPNKNVPKTWIPIAKKEIEYREDHPIRKEDTEKKSDDLADLRAEVTKLKDKIIIGIIKNPVRGKYFDNQIKLAKTKEELGLLSAQINMIEILYHSGKNKAITREEYPLFFDRIIVADKTGVDKIGEELIAKKGNDKVTIEVLDGVRHSIQNYFEKNNVSPSIAMNSMMKHLGVDDQYACNDINKLDKYYEYLSNKPKVKEKEKPTVMKGQISGKPLEKEDGVIFTDEEQTEDNTQEELEIG